MGVHHIVNQLAEKGILLHLDSGVLKTKAPKGVMNQNVITMIKDNKQALISFLSKAVSAQNTQQRVIAKASRDKPIPLSFAQQRFWLVEQLQQQSSHYNMPMALKVDGKFCVDAARQAFTTIIDRHEILRTVYRSHQNHAEQVINPAGQSCLTVVDLTKVTDQLETLQQLVSIDATKPFDLSQDLMLRATWVQLAAEQGVLLFNMHHIASDGWSMGILMREFMSCYQAYVEGKSIQLPALEIQYADYAIWQQTTIADQELERQLSYWKQQLDGAPSVHNLPLDFERPAQSKHQGARVSARLNPDVASALTKVAQQQGVTMFMVLHASLSLLLSRYSNSTDIVIGTPVANRLNKALEPMLGCFVNTLALRSNCAEHQTFCSYLAHIKQLNLDAQVNQDVPFELLLEHLNVPRDQQVNPLVQVMYSMDTTEQSTMQMNGLTFSAVDSDRVAAKFDLNLAGDITENSGSLHWIYDSALFKHSTVEQMNTHLINLLTAIAATPNAKLSELNMLDAEQSQRLLTLANNNLPELPPQSSIHQRFSEMALRYPDNVALICEQRTLSYQQLERKANQLAHYLIAKGVVAGACVGMAYARSEQMVIAMLAILKAGGVYVPLDPNYPQHRLAHMVADSGLKLLLTERALVNYFENNAFDCLVSETMATQLLDCPIEAPLVEHLDGGVNCAEDLAYINYTSGSTGLPKGVMVPHMAVHRLVVDTDFIELDQSTCFMQAASISFDAATLELWGPLLNGGCCVLYHQARIDLAVLNQLIAKHQVNSLWLTAGLFDQWSRCSANLPSLKWVLAGGDVINPQAVAAVQQNLPDATIINGYGPTENTTFSCCYQIPNMAAEQSTNASAAIPIGTAIAQSQAYILDTHLALTPIGCVGELYVGGYGLAQGYLNQPQLTAQRFINNPYDERVGAKLYRTGDLVKMRPDGVIEFVGRVDHQVKIRGFRVELSEIEEQLNALELVHSTLVTVAGVEANNKRLVAYLKPVNHSSHSKRKMSDVIAQIKTQLQQNLPEHMMPSAFVIIDEWPLTANGKIDRKALPEADISESFGRYLAPKGKTQQQLSQLWAELLKCPVEKVSASGNFFEMGGHSLLAVRLANEIRAQFGVQWSVTDVFSAATIIEQAQQIDKLEQTSLDNLIKVVSRNKPLPLSFGQQRLWFINELEQGNNAQYNIPFALKINGRFDSQIAEQALKRIIERHEILRSTYAASHLDIQAVQVVHNKVDWQLNRVDLRHLPKSQQNQQVQRLVDNDSNTPFDLSHDVMLRASWLQLNDEQGVLLLNLHHIVADGWSMGVLVKEFAALYQAFNQNLADPLPALAIQYADFAHWQRHQLDDEQLQQKIQLWCEKLIGAPVVHGLPLDYQRPQQQHFIGDMVKGELCKDKVDRLQAIAQQQGMTLFMLLHGALGLLLSRHSNSKDIVIGTPVANRLTSELEPLIGFFVNVLVLRSEHSQCHTLADYLTHIKQVNLDAQQYQDIPFEQLVDRLNIPRTSEHSPLFQIMLSMNNNEQGDLNLDGLSFTPLQSSTITAKFDLELNVDSHQEGLSFSWVYNKQLFKPDTIKRLNQHFAVLLEGMMVSAESQLTQDGLSQCQLSQLPMLTEQQQDELMTIAHQANASYPNHKLLHHLLSEQARQTPTRDALYSAQGTMSYEQLEQQANQLAHYLIEQGVIVDSLVGVMMDRSMEMIVSLMAILKAGGAYVPLDPENPDARLSFIIQDTQMQCIVTQAAFATRIGALTASEAVSQVPHCVVVDDIQTTLASLAVQAPSLASHRPNNLAYVIYTSGSTGQPKGVLIEHQSVVNLTYSLQDLGLGERDKPWGWCASFAFDASAQGISQLLLGQPLAIISHEEKLDVSILRQRVIQAQISVIDCTPSILELWLSQGGAAFLPDLIIGGEAISQALWQDLLSFQADTGRQAYNVYGPTECTVDSTWTVVDTKEPHIGQAIANNQCYVLNDALQLVPKGTEGELYIGGLGLARGYLNRPELTDERFIRHPFASDPSARLYQTDDRVKMNPDGTLKYLGRVDNQVKFNGYRIETGEIECELSQCDKVASAVVAISGQALVAYVMFDSHKVVADEPQQPLFEQLKTHLQQQLPSYMVPSVFIAIEQWPMTHNGKIDFKALSKCQGLSLQQYVPPSCENEQIMCDIWQRLLGLEQVGIDDNFFDLGGHSLLAIKLMAIIAEQLGHTLALKALFAYPTPKALVEHLHLISSGVKQVGLFSVDALIANNTQDKLFICPALGLMGLSYQPLAAALAGRFNSMVLTTPGIDEMVGDDSPKLKVNFEQRVDDWYRAIKAQQSSGHYRLLGHSFGGAVAFELASRLESQGNSACVVLLDSVLATPALASQHSSLSQMLLGPEITQELSNQQLHSKLLKSKLIPEELTVQQFEIYALAAKQQLALFSNYRPSREVKGQVHMLMAREGLESHEAKSKVLEHIQSWCVKPLDCAVVEGNHLSVSKEPQLATELIQKLS